MLLHEDIEFALFDKVMANPTTDCVYQGAAFAKKHKVDFIIAIGGGSPMDAAKAIALVATQNIKQEDLFCGKYSDNIMPIIAVPTTAGTGSEATQYSIITNDIAQTKSGIACPALFPKVSFLDAQYTMTLDPITTLNTTIDALTHAIEGMLSVRATIISDSLAVKSIDMIMKSIPIIKSSLLSGTTQDIDINTRQKLLYASFLAGMVIAQTGTVAVHAMGYSLTYFKHIDHGRANGLLLAEYLRFVEDKDIKLAKSIYNAMGINGSHECKSLMDDLFGKKEALSESNIKLFSEKAAATKNIPNSKVPVDKNDIAKIFTNSFC